ncbi:MAG: InlB B-repeat-containing protein, partial [Paludibacteraceae bacterium]|nr:InlB B-repeat-containing protein [Paludibacteraceae bacterium]
FDDPTTASYTAPVFAASGVNPTRPTDPERPGYTFGGWYANSNLSGSQFNFNTPLTADTTLYAKWTPTTNGTSYMVVFWVQSVSDEVNTSDNHKEYDFGYSEIRTGTACSNAALTISNSGTDADNRRGYNNSSSYRSLVIAFNQTNTIDKNGWSSVNGTKPIRGDGGTVLNVYYDRRAITYIFADGYTTNPYSGAITYTNPRTFSGLYGQPFSEEAFPATGDQFWKCVEQNATINRYINGFTFFDNTNSTYHFVPNTLTGLKNIYEKTQKLNADGTGVLDEYDLKYTYFVRSINGSALIDSDTFPGFEGYKYNYSGDNLTGASDFPSTGLTVDGSKITGNGAYLYFNRLAYDLDFNSNGTRVRHETVYFEAPLSRFADYVPDNGPRECFFDGWFSDQQLTQKHNLLTATMPNGTKTVFAKWTPKKYRVILNNVSPSDGVTAPSGAQASFLVNGGERIDKNALEGFTCNGKRLMGWYTDPEFKHPFNPESLIYDTVSDVNTYYGEKMPDETDAAYNARMNGATRTDTDSITNATWDDRWDTDNPDSYAVQRTVRSQLQLYALWRADPYGAVGMHVTYLGDNLPDTGYFDVTEPTFHPHTWKDPNLYSDHSWAYAQPASVPDRPDDRQFLYWEILNKQGEPTGKKVYPGQTFEILLDDAYQGTEPPTNCEHTEREFVAAVAATCDTAGNSAHYRCTNCGRRFATNDPSDTTVINPTIPALGHNWNFAQATYSWDDTVTPYTCTATAHCTRNGEHTLTETVNGVPHEDTPATGSSAGLGHYTATFTNTGFAEQTINYIIPELDEVTVSFVVPTGVTPVDSRSEEPGSTISLPSAGAPSGYTFLGWVTTPMADTGTAPSSSSYMTAGSNYSVPNSDSTLYALYSYQAYELLTSTPSDWVGDYVITSGTDSNMLILKGLSGTTSHQSSSGASSLSASGATLNGNKLQNVDDLYVFQISASGNGYTLQNKSTSTYLYADSTNGFYSVEVQYSSGMTWGLAYSNGC